MLHTKKKIIKGCFIAFIAEDVALMFKAPVSLGRRAETFSNREQSETNRNDENAMFDYLAEYLRMCFRLYVDS